MGIDGLQIRPVQSYLIPDLYASQFNPHSDLWRSSVEFSAQSRAEKATKTLTAKYYWAQGLPVSC